jgi:hypothetical protein
LLIETTICQDRLGTNVELRESQYERRCRRVNTACFSE